MTCQTACRSSTRAGSTGTGDEGAVGIANVVLRLPVEVTGMHSALAALLVLVLTAAMREAYAARDAEC